MKTLKLKPSHRIVWGLYANAAFQQGGLSLSEMDAMLKTHQKLVLTDEEKTEYNFRVEKNEKGEDAQKWAEPEEGKDFELTDVQFDLIKEVIKKMDDKKMISWETFGTMADLANLVGYEFVKE